jgi:outer membrane protein TolC
LGSPATLGLADLPAVAGEKIDYRQPLIADRLPSAFDFSRPLTLQQILELAADNSREYHLRKEKVFASALDLNLAAYDFGIHIDDFKWDSVIEEDLSGGTTSRGLSQGASIGLSRQFLSGSSVRTSLALDLVHLLRARSASSLGLMSDHSISIPLLRGRGAHITAEPLTSAERSVEYAIAEFDFYRREFVVRIARQYYEVLQAMDQVHNAQANYGNLKKATKRVAAIAQSGRLPASQVDQSRQDAYRSSLRLVDAQARYAERLDTLKESVGYPVDACLELEQSELTRLATQFSIPETAPWEQAEVALFEVAFKNRHDVQTFFRKVEDAQRAVVLAQDALLAEITIGGEASLGGGRSLSSVDSEDVYPEFDRGRYQALLHVDFALDRVAESHRLRKRVMDLEEAIRSCQAREDALKRSIRTNVRRIKSDLENYKTQVSSLALAHRRVERANLFLEAGRIEVRDLLEAQEALLDSQNALTKTIVDYRIHVWAFERDLGILNINQLI